MQSNDKKSKSNKVFDYFLSEKFKPTSLSKYFWIFGLLVIFIGTVMLCSIGFNLGMDYTGGNIITVKSGEDTYDDAKYNQIQSEITKVFNENGLSVSRLQKSGTGSTAEIQIQYQKLDFSLLNRCLFHQQLLQILFLHIELCTYRLILPLVLAGILLWYSVHIYHYPIYYPNSQHSYTHGFSLRLLFC